MVVDVSALGSPHCFELLVRWQVGCRACKKSTSITSEVILRQGTKSNLEQLQKKKTS